MLSQSIDIHNIDEGVDRKQLAQLKQRFLTLNQIRYARTCAALSDRQQQFLVLLPLFFHINHPMLPGYVSHGTPCGVFSYEPDTEQLRTAKTLARSFHYQRDLMSRPSAIDALFIMGSVGTIAQNDNSDMDIWVCHGDGITAAAMQELEQKCQLISTWAAQQIHLEVHFFLMRSDNFHSHKKQTLSSEASGSAQHYLLLDEFYRTALWLAGKVPLWWFVPASQEQDYETYTQKLLGKRFIKAADVIDFGGLPEIPANEFIGAGIWQLYKAIESPYKSVLKLLLLEVYANDAGVDADNVFSHSEPLALGYKRAVYAAAPDPNALDPYVMVYRRIEDYLLARGQHPRLELVRRCLYFKVNKPLSRTSAQATKSWQRLLLETLVDTWQWNTHQLHMLDNRAYWKSPHVIVERTLLVNELTHSYRLLTELNKHQEASVAISSDELMILGRKLHAAFERKAGKIEWINPGISRDLSEPALCFVREQNETGESWQVLRGSQSDLALRHISVEPIRRSRSLLELLFWCHANGILVQRTRIDIVDKDFLLSGVQKQQLVQALEHWLPVPLAPVEHQQFMRPAVIRRMLLLFNIGVEPQLELYKKGMQMLSTHSDALGYSGLKENLVVSVDIAQINSWGELVCRHYSSDPLVNCLLHYLRLLPPGKSNALPDLTVRCFSRGQGSNIAQRITELWRDIIACYYSGTHLRTTRYIFEMGDEYLLLQVFQQQPQILRFKQYEKLLEKLAQAQTDYSPILIDRYGLRDRPLRLISQAIKSRGVYVFYQRENSLAQVTIVDEKGSLFTTQMPFHHEQTLLRPLVGFIRSAMQRQQLDGDYIPMATDTKSILIYELSGNFKHQQGHIEPRYIHNDLSQLHFINIKAIAELDAEEHIRFTIYCDEHEFSALAYGDTLFDTVAQYIFTRRQRGERYHCYITDLDLSLCRDVIAQQTGLQLGHYLHIKAELEQKLNAALMVL